MSSLNSAVEYLQSVRKKILLISCFLAVVTVSFVYDISDGSGNYPLADVVATILNKDAISVQMEVVIWDYRMPIAIMAIVIGAMLALAGAQMQTILNNPLADPFTLGIASAASFGAALGIVLGIGLPVEPYFIITSNAFVFAFATSLILYGVTKLRGVTIETMILVGIAMMFTFGALVALLQYASNETQLQQLIFWTMGSLGKATWNKIAICLVVLFLSCMFFTIKVWPMTALRLGDEKARSMGINVGKLRLQMLLIISLLSSLAVSYVGVVGFVGLVGPHIARMLVGEDQRFFLIMSALAGATIMSLTSIVSKNIIDGAIFPIGIITSLIGIPFFVSLILSVRRQSW